MITGRLTGDAAVLLRLRSMGIRIHDRLRREVTAISIDLTRYVKESKLSGQVLKNRTGTLRRKINYEVRESASSIISSVGVKLSYAAPHEYGIDKVVTVREHVRHIASRDVRGKIDGRRKQVAAGVGYVREHQRHMQLPERSYLRSSLRDKASSIRERLRLAVMEEVQ